MSPDRLQVRLTTYRRPSLLEQLTPRRIAALTVATGLAIAAIGTSAGPNKTPDSPNTVTHSKPDVPTASPRKLFMIEGKTAPEIIESALRDPSSPMLRTFHDAYDINGLLVTDFRDCTQDPSAMPRIFTEEAKRRPAPFKNIVEIAPIQKGDQFNAAIEATIRDITGRKSDEIWMAEITEERMTWAAREEKYRRYAMQA